MLDREQQLGAHRAMKPILYTFRRCPYAIRARLAIAVSGVEVDAREVDLKNKPAAMLLRSPKGSVPVLQFTDGGVIDESLEIMRWALAIRDPDEWIVDDADWTTAVSALIGENDGPFKWCLDRYKYPGRFQLDVPTHAATHYRDEAGTFLRTLNARLTKHGFLMGESLSLADAAIFPFVRQFAQVDQAWFYAAYHGPLSAWLDRMMQSPLFLLVMQKK